MGTLGPLKPHPPRNSATRDISFQPRGPWHQGRDLGMSLGKVANSALARFSQFLTRVSAEMSAGRGGIIFSPTQGGCAGHRLTIIKQGYCERLLSPYCLPRIVLSTLHTFFY